MFKALNNRILMILSFSLVVSFVTAMNQIEIIGERQNIFGQKRIILKKKKELNNEEKLFIKNLYNNIDEVPLFEGTLDDKLENIQLATICPYRNCHVVFRRNCNAVGNKEKHSINSLLSRFKFEMSPHIRKHSNDSNHCENNLDPEKQIFLIKEKNAESYKRLSQTKRKKKSFIHELFEHIDTVPVYNGTLEDTLKDVQLITICPDPECNLILTYRANCQREELYSIKAIKRFFTGNILHHIREHAKKINLNNEEYDTGLGEFIFLLKEHDKEVYQRLPQAEKDILCTHRSYEHKRSYEENKSSSAKKMRISELVN